MKRILLTVAFLAFLSPANAQTCPLACPTSDDAEIQGMLDAAAAAGGGVVQLEARVYQTCTALVVKSNVHLRGAGRGATIIRGSATITGVILDNAYLSASVGSIGAHNISISDLTIDHATCSRDSNGIALLPSGTPGGDVQAYDGTVPTNALITNLEVLGSPSFHNYMIWNLKGQHIKIVNNWVDGGATFTTAQEGIESFGGYDVVIANNTVKNIGTACVNLGSAGIVDSDTKGIFVENNYLSGCNDGVHLGTSDENGNQLNAHTHIRGNVIRDTRKTGIDVAVAPTTSEINLDISHNSIRNISGDLAAGIQLRATEGALDASAVIANTIESNLIANVRGRYAHGIRLMEYLNARVLNNTIVGTDNDGIFVRNSIDTEIVGNRIEATATTPIGVYRSGGGQPARVVVERNRIHWATSATGILMLGVNRGSVRDNVFSSTAPGQPSPVVVADQACGITVTGNLPWYTVNWVNVSSAACP